MSIVNNASVKRKGEDREVSGSLYTGEESEDYEEVEVSKVASLLSICLFVLYCFSLCVSMLFTKFGTNSACFLPIEASQVAKVAHTKNPTSSENISVRGAQASKRVVAQAPQEQHVPARMTRQKTRDLAPALSPDPQEVLNLGLSNATPTHDPSQQQDLVGITDEG